MNRDCIPNEEAEKYFFHFPDGNASIARLLVRKLIPHAIPGHSLKDLPTARARYARLDDAHSHVRIRLNSTVVRVAHEGDPQNAKQVEIVYVKGGKLFRVRASQCVLACWNMVIPYICTELPARQREALAKEAKVPIVYTNVVLRNWTSWKKLRVSSVYAPGCYHTHVNLDLTSRPWPLPLFSRAGGTHCGAHDADAVQTRGLPSYDQHRAGRSELFQTSFETFERNILRPTVKDSGRRRFRPRARHCSHHREPMAARLCLRIQFAIRQVLARRRRNPVRGSAAAVWPLGP